MNRYVFGNSHNERDLRIDGLLDGFRCFIRCNIYRGCMRFQVILGLSNPSDP